MRNYRKTALAAACVILSSVLSGCGDTGTKNYDKLLDKDFKHIGEHLKDTPAADTHRAETTLEPSAELAFIEYVKQGKERVNQEDDNSYDDTFDERCRPLRHEAGKQAVEP